MLLLKEKSIDWKTMTAPLTHKNGMLSARRAAERAGIPYKKFQELKRLDVEEGTLGKRVPRGLRRVACKYLLFDYDPKEIDEWVRNNR